MTTPVLNDIARAIDYVSVLSSMKDRDALQLLGRFTASQRTVLEAQVAQLRQMEEAISAQLKSLK